MQGSDRRALARPGATSLTRYGACRGHSCHSRLGRGRGAPCRRDRQVSWRGRRRGVDRSLLRRPLHRSEDQRAVGAAEAEGVGQRHADRQLAGFVGHVVEIAGVVGVVEVDRGVRRLIADGEDGEHGFHRASRAEQVADHRLRRTHRHLGVVAEYRLDGKRFGNVALGCGSAVGVDVLHVVRVEPGVAQGVLHGAHRAVTVVGRTCDVVGVAAHAEPGHLAVDVGAARLGMLVLLEHQHRGAVAEHEAIPVSIPRAAGAFRVVVARGERAHGSEAGNGDGRGGLLGAAHHHHVRIAAFDQAGAEANVVGAGGAGGHEGEVGATEAILDGEVAGDHVDDAGRNEEWRNPRRASIQVGGMGGLDGVDAADAGADGDADSVAVVRRVLKTGVTHGLNAGRHAVLDEGVESACLAPRHVGLDIEVLDAGGDGHRLAFGVEGVDGRRAAAPGQGACPGLLDGIADGAEHPKARHHYSPLGHAESPNAWSESR